MKHLVIVESPTKAKTIRKYLPNNYQVEASMGHVRDLPAKAEQIPKELKDQAWSRIGINVDENFEPLYIIPPNKKKVVSQLKAALKDADSLFIATDEDREGESIGWHLLEVLQPNVPVKRMVFHEITEMAINEALLKTRDIDQDLVDAQETRRMLDRLVGYSISPLLWKKVAPKLSAGRVQSVAVRLLVLRERERLAFMSASYWDLKSTLSKTSDPKNFDATMTRLNDIRLATGKDFDPDTGLLKSNLTAGKDVLMLPEAQARSLSEHLQKEAWQVKKIERRQAKRSPSAPFTTSTLQQESSRKLGLAAKDTMRTAQSLYENGYITYMRTDSTNLSNEAIDASRKAVENRYGNEYLSAEPRQFKGKSKNAQEAHEAIRPAGTEMKTPQELGLQGVEAKLYDLIWKRTVATQMAEARLTFVTATIEAGKTDVATFRASGKTIDFPGFFRAYVEGSDDPDSALDDQEQPLPELTEGQVLDCHDLEALGHETKPPARFTEASLVKMLEQEGIGRPSTYASIIDTIIKRGYVRKQGSALVPSFTAFATNNVMEKQFNQLVDVGFTANMENILDDIATGDAEGRPYLAKFYKGDDGITHLIDNGAEELDPREMSTITDPKWGDITVRVGRYGPYAERISGELDENGELVIERGSLPYDIAPADIDREMLVRVLEEGATDGKELGIHPDGEKMLLRQGPYGPYVQLGDSEKPKRMSLPKGMMLDEVTEEVALGLLSMPRELGVHPESGKVIQASIGRFGPYVKHASTFASLKKEDDVLTVELPRALELIIEKELKNKPLKTLGEHPETGVELNILQGRYGPYVKHNRTNQSLPKDASIEDFTLEDAVKLLEGKISKSSAKKSKAKKKAGPKATTEELAGFLDMLSEQDAKVVSLIEGMNGNEKRDILSITDELDLSEEEVKKIHKSSMFKLRMAFGRSRKPVDDSKPKKKKAPAGPKATITDLENHLDSVDEQAQQVVIYLEGMKDTEKKDAAAVAVLLGMTEDDVKKVHKSSMFKMRMAFGRARKPVDPTKKAKKAPSGPKATTADLEKHLESLDDSKAQEVVSHIEGMKGMDKKDAAAVAVLLGMTEEDVKKMHKSAMFKLRMTFGRARKEQEAVASAA